MWSVGGLSPAIDGIAAYHTAAGDKPPPYTNFAAESPLPLRGGRAWEGGGV